MRLAKAAVLPASSTAIQKFGGYDTRPAAAENTFCRMENISGDACPALTVRRPRARVQAVAGGSALCAHNALAWVANGTFYYGGEPRFSLGEGEKRLVGMGAGICIFPDKLVFDTVTGEVKAMENVTAAENVSVCLCDDMGIGYDALPGELPPDEPLDGEYWLDTSDEEGASLKRWSDAAGQWLAVTEAYVALRASGIGAGFAAYDGVEISGAGDMDGGHILQYAGRDVLVLDGGLIAPFRCEGQVTVSRLVPDMDFVCEQNNRLWGAARSGRELYACKLGDPTNWQYFSGLSTDSYTLTEGSPGPFTGACGFQGEVLFFKEDRILKVMGTRPANYQLAVTHCRGVAAHSEKSLCAVDETLYWLSREGVMAYDGGMPYKISQPLDCLLTDGCAGGVNGRYYLCAKEGAGDRALLVYRSDAGLWHRENGGNIRCFACYRGELYWLDGENLMAARGILPYTYTENGVEQTRWEEPVTFFAQTPCWDMNYPHHKYLRRLTMRLSMAEGAKLRVLVRYDSRGEWLPLGGYAALVRQSVDIPLHPARCDHLQLRLEGSGDITLWSITRRVETGN